MADGKEVGHGDTKYNDDVEHHLPILDHRLEHLHQNGAKREGCGSLRDNTQITSNGGRSTLVGIGRPEVEGNERNLEA